MLRAQREAARQAKAAEAGSQPVNPVGRPRVKLERERVYAYNPELCAFQPRGRGKPAKDAVLMTVTETWNPVTSSFEGPAEAPQAMPAAGSYGSAALTGSLEG